MTEDDFPKLHIEDDADGRRLFEATDRGYLAGVSVELADGSRHPVFFYDPVRLVQELEDDTKRGRAFIAEKGMIVVNDVTLDSMTAAVRELARQGFFAKD